MKRLFAKWLSVLLVICLSLTIVPTALMEETVEPQVESLNEALQEEAEATEAESADEATGNEKIIIDATDSEVIETEEEIAFDEPGQDVSEETEVIPSANEEHAVPFYQEIILDDVTICVSGAEGVFPEGATLHVEKVEDQAAADAVEALFSTEGEYKHLQYRVEVLDAAGNVILPNVSEEQPMVRVRGLNVTGDIRVALFDDVSKSAFEVEAESNEGEVSFAFIDSTVYDVTTFEISETQQEEDPSEEQSQNAPEKIDEPVEDTDKPEGKKEENSESEDESKDKDNKSEENKDESEDKEDKTEDKEDESEDKGDESEDKEEWQTAEVVPVNDGTELVEAELDEAAKLMESNSLLAAQAASYEYLPSILTVGDVYDLKKCLLIDGYEPSDVVSWKSSKKRVVRISGDGTLTALKAGKAKITVKTSDKKKRKISVSVRSNVINGLFPRPSKAEAVALGDAFSIRPKSLKHIGKGIEAEFYLLNGSKNKIRYLKDLNMDIYLGSRNNKLTSRNFSRIKVKGKKKGVSTFKITFPASSVLIKNVHFADYTPDKVYFSLDTKHFYATAGKKSVPFVETVIPNLPEPVLASGIVLSTGSLSLSVGSSAQLTATVLPQDAEDKSVGWSSSNPGVATIDGSGRVTAVAAGEATITATALGGLGVVESCTVTVKDPNANVNAESLTLDKTSVTIAVGETATITSTLLPADASETAINYNLSPSGYGKVNSASTKGNIGTFVVEGVKEGTTTLKVSAKSNSSINASCTIKVVKQSSTQDPASVPNAPRNVTAVAQSTSSIKVTWSKSTSSDVTGYKLYYGTSSSSSSASLYKSYGSSTTSATVTGLKAGTRYYFWLKATNSAGDSAFSSSDYDVTSQEFNINVSHPDHPNIIKNGVIGESTIDVFNGKATMTWNVDCTTDWSVSCNGSMISWLEKTNNNTQLVITIDEGVASGSRTATITIKANGNNYKITLRQTAEKALSVSHRDHPNIIKDGIIGEDTIDVFNGTATMNWTVDCGTDWSVTSSGAMISSAKKTSSTQLTISIKDGVTSGSRTATVTISAGGNSYTITLKQTAEGGSLPSTLYVKQNTSKTCTLASAVMMMRARAYLSGSSVWSSITESSTQSTAWLTGEGLYNSFTYKWSGNSISVSSSTTENRITTATIKSYLNSHPEGIVLYVFDKPHAIFITDCVGDTFYCADPAGSYSGNRIKVADSYMCKYYGWSQADLIGHADKIWYVSSYSISK